MIAVDLDDSFVKLVLHLLHSSLLSLHLRHERGKHVLCLFVLVSETTLEGVGTLLVSIT